MYSGLQTEKTYSFECKKCKIITFVDFEKIANEKCVVILKQRCKEKNSWGKTQVARKEKKFCYK